MRATQHFHCGLLLGTTRIKEKKFRETHGNVFGVFGFLEQANKREKQKQEKLFTRESSQQEKKEQGNLLGFLFSAIANYSRKKIQNEAGNIFVFSQVFSNTQKESEKINLTWIIQ